MPKARSPATGPSCATESINHELLDETSCMREVPNDTNTAFGGKIPSEYPILEPSIIESDISALFYVHAWRVDQT